VRRKEGVSFGALGWREMPMVLRLLAETRIRRLGEAAQPISVHPPFGFGVTSKTACSLARQYYFSSALRASGCTPAAVDTNLMAPEAYTLKSALDAWESISKWDDGHPRPTPNSRSVERPACSPSNPRLRAISRQCESDQVWASRLGVARLPERHNHL